MDLANQDPIKKKVTGSVNYEIHFKNNLNRYVLVNLKILGSEHETCIHDYCDEKENKKRIQDGRMDVRYDKANRQ